MAVRGSVDARRSTERGRFWRGDTRLCQGTHHVPIFIFYYKTQVECYHLMTSLASFDLTENIVRACLIPDIFPSFIGSGR